MPKNWRENLKFKIKKLEKGDTFYDFDNYKNHIVDFAQDGDNKIVIYKCWIRHKGYWKYYCDRMEILLYRITLIYEDTIPKKDRAKFFEMNGVEYGY